MHPVNTSESGNATSEISAWNERHNKVNSIESTMFTYTETDNFFMTTFSPLSASLS